MTESKIEHELKLINGRIAQLDFQAKTLEGWVARHWVMKFFQISHTSMYKLEKKHSLPVSKIGSKKFYKVDAIKELLEKHLITK